MALYHSPDYQTSFKSIGLLFQEKKFNKDFQDGGHLRLPISIILATFDLQVILMLPMKLSSQFAFWFRIKEFKINFQHGR